MKLTAKLTMDCPDSILYQRYETNGKADNGLPGLNIVFKKMPNDEELVKLTGSEYNLGTGRDRVQVYDYQVHNLISRYAVTMSDAELTQTISSLENIWKIQEGKDVDSSQLGIVRALVQEAKRRNLGIDFSKEKYVYLNENAEPEDYQMARLMGYKIANPVMRDVGMQECHSFSNGKKKPLEPAPELAAKIHLIDEGIKILQENADLNTHEYITKADTEKPTLIFDQGGSPNEAAEAITRGDKYLGHWVKLSSLALNNYVGNLATWIHEISHKTGGDTSETFSLRLIDVQKYIMNVLTHNPAALEKIKVLADIYADKAPDAAVHFDEAAYTANLKTQLNAPFKYEEYVENIQSDNTSSANTGTQFSKVINFEENISKGRMLEKITPSSYVTRIIDKIKTFVKKSRKEKDTIETTSSTSTNNTSTYEYEKFHSTPSPDEYLKLPSTEEYTHTLFTDGKPVKFVIPDTGGMNPTRAEVPEIHPEDTKKLGKTENARIKIRYGAKTNWSNTKIARDIMQNFYDGNGHTMEGVGVEVTPQPDGTYKIRITGDGHYDYSHLESLGDSTKDGNSANAGAFGEGTRIVAVNLLSRLDTKYVEYACGDWSMKFGRSSDDIQTADMTQTLNQNQTPVKGNYIEFTTADKDLVSTIIDARDYFGHPYNKDFQTPTFENEYFAFKVDENPDATGNLYYVQRYETEDGKISGGLNNLTIMFKRSVDDPALIQAANRRYYAVDSGRDRMALNKNQLYELGWYYAKTMSNEDLTKAIASLEPVLTSTSSADAKLLYNTKDSSIQFARGLIAEAGSRGLKIDFSDAKIVYVSGFKYGGSILPEKIETYLRDKGYKFAYMDCQKLGMKSAQEVYDMEHKPHSLKPTDKEVRKLRLLRQAIELFAQNDTSGTIPPLTGKSEYVFDANDSNNTSFHALVKDKNYDGLFIDRQTLATTDFMTLVSYSIAEILKVSGDLKSASYSYELTELISSQLNTFLTRPDTAEKLKVLEQMYNQIGKNN